MNIISINLNDTIALSDSTIIELAKLVNSCQPCIQDSPTNCQDVKVVAIICVTIVFVALIAKWAIWSWQNAVITSKEQERKDKDEKEVAECKRKLDADKTNREWQLADEERNRNRQLADEERKRQNQLADEALKRKNAIEDEERQRKYKLEDEERKHAYDKEK